MACDIGPIQHLSPAVQLQIDYAGTPAFILLPDGHCQADLDRLAAVASYESVEGGKTTMYVARALLAALRHDKGERNAK